MKALRLLALACASAGATFAQAPAAPAAPPAAAPTEEVLHIPEPGRFKDLFRPFRTDNAALSPDGKFLAYSVREGDAVSVVVIEIDHPEKMTAQVRVIDDETATPMLNITQTERTPGRINWLGWTTPTRLVVGTNRVLPKAAAGGQWLSWRGTVLGFDADGGNARILADPKDTQEFIDDAGVPHAVPEIILSGGDANGTGQRYRGSAAQPVNENRPPDDNLMVDENAPLLPLPDDRLAAAEAGGVMLQRTLRIFDHDPARPGAVTVLVTRGSRFAFYSLDGQSGKLKALNDDVIHDNSDALLDRQGRLRLTVPIDLKSTFPFRYEYWGAKGRDRAKPLDAVTGLTGFSVSPENYFGERAIPLGFDHDSDILYYAANQGRDTFGVYSLNLSTKQRGRLAMENPVYDLVGAPDQGFPNVDALVIDRFDHQLAGVRFEGALSSTAWIRPEWQEMQAAFESAFRGRSVKILDWDQGRKRFVVATEGPADPGAFFIYDAGQKKLLEFVRRAPWIDAHQTHATVPFSYATKDGAQVSGLLTVPRKPRLRPTPMVVLCPDLPWQRVRSDFQSEVQALAEMGFVVVQLNGRGAWGLGLKQRQSLTAGYDQVQAEDIVTAVTSLEQLFKVNPQRVALMGRGHGGFVALRTLQAYPDKFRCAIALDAPVNLGDWLDEQRWTVGNAQPQLTRAWFGDEARLRAAPLVSQPEAITKPVLMLNYPGPVAGRRRAAFSAAHQFSGRVQAHGATVEFGELTTDYMNGLPVARAAVFDRIEAFLNTHIYDFTVKVHETQIAK